MPPQPVVETFETAPIGAYLRRQRMLRDVSLEELSQNTRIPLRSLQRLEAGEFDGESDGFVRGFVRTVAASLGLDVDDAVSRLLQEPAVGTWERHSGSRRLKQAFALGVFGVMLVCGFLILQAGWRLVVGQGGDAADREVVTWHDPVHALAEAAGVVVDPAGEIDPSRGSREPEAGAVPRDARPSRGGDRISGPRSGSETASAADAPVGR